MARGLVLLCTLGALAACGGSSDTSGNLDASHIAPSPTDGAVGDVSSTADGAGEPSSTDSVGAGPGADGGATLEPECLVDEDCDVVGMACSCLGECVDVSGKTTCTEPKNCGSSGWCDPCTGHCEPMVGLCQPCSTAGLCAPGGACRAPEDGACAEQGVCVPFASGGNFCGQACLSALGCPTGYDCVEVPGAAEKQCLPQSGVCSDLGLCQGDAECPEGEICMDGPQVCAPGCVDDEACPSGLVCDQARCVEPCASNDECTLPELCDDGGHCADPNACASWTDCPPEHYCHKTDGMCVPGCQLDEQCADASKVCEGGACVAKGCEHNYQCAFEEECVQDTGDCGPMTRPHCSTCDAAVDDPAQCGGEPNLCVTFQDNEGAEVGDFCILTCDADPIDSCPQGYGCEHLEMPDAGIDGHYCVRQCWQDPYGG